MMAITSLQRRSCDCARPIAETTKATSVAPRGNGWMQMLAALVNFSSAIIRLLTPQ